jgi:hypothetical protein
VVEALAVVPSRNTIVGPSRTSVVVPSRTSGTKYIKVVEALAVVDALAVVEALETTAYINSILELI